MLQAHNIRLVYASEVDVSVDNGRGINEREFVKSLLADHEAAVTCVLPVPSQPEVFFDPRIEYVHSHGHGALHYPLYVVSTIRRILRLHRALPLDGLIVRLDVTPIVAWVAHRLGIPLFIKTLAVYAPFGARRGSMWKPRAWMRRAFRPMYRSVIENAAAADTMSITFRRWLEETFDITADRLRVIQNGANPEEFTPHDRDRSRARVGLEGFRHVVGYAGVLGPGRYLDVLIDAFADLSPPTDIGLVLLGWGPDRERLEAQATSRGVSSQVLLPGPVPYAEVPRYLRAFDVGVDLSATDIAMRNGVERASFSQKIAQYLASGVPVLGWDFDDTRFIESARVGGLASFPSRASLRGALGELLSLTDGRREEMVARSREYAVSHLSTDTITASRVAWWRETALKRSAERSPGSTEPDESPSDPLLAADNPGDV